MKLCIVGQGQLAQVTAICCEPYHERVQPKDAEVLWVCYDTPLKANHEPDVEWIKHWAGIDVDQSYERLTKVLISSPLPVGTTKWFEDCWPHRIFAYSPENIRVAHGVEDFMHQARIVVGRRDPKHDAIWVELLHRFCLTLDHKLNIIWTTPETAEMSKHALNAYLAMNIAFANEIGRLCEAVGADSFKVAQALLSERRVSKFAPLLPGEPYGGGHLSRDLWVLNELALKIGLTPISIPILSHIEASNQCATVPTTSPTAPTPAAPLADH